MNLKNLGIIKWIVEALFRMSKNSPLFFRWTIGFGFAVFLVPLIIHGLIHWWHIPVPGFLCWLDNGYISGFGSGVAFISILTTQRDEISGQDISKKMPVTAKEELKKEAKKEEHKDQ